jgi:hypothetical protein
MAFTSEEIRDSFRRAGDEHWQALIRHHEDAYPECACPLKNVGR